MKFGIPNQTPCIEGSCSVEVNQGGISGTFNPSITINGVPMPMINPDFTPILDELVNPGDTKTHDMINKSR